MNKERENSKFRKSFFADYLTLNPGWLLMKNRRVLKWYILFRHAFCKSKNKSQIFFEMHWSYAISQRQFIVWGASFCSSFILLAVLRKIFKSSEHFDFTWNFMFFLNSCPIMSKLYAVCPPFGCTIYIHPTRYYSS